MAGAPDPKPTRRKGNKPRRIVDPKQIALAKAKWPHCASCGRWALNDSGHHVLPKDKGGDDVQANIVVLCGSGTSRCHGAHHGSPYVFEGEGGTTQRRDADWVNIAVGLHLLEARHDVLSYVLGKLGEEAGQAFLARQYMVTIDDLRDVGLA